MKPKANKKPKAVCFFNNKGGVGKTTLVANLAAELALNHSKDVLLVDADPQCNLTQYILPEAEFMELYGKPEPETIYSIIHPISLGKGYRSSLPTKRSDSFGCSLLVGDPRLGLKEDLLAQDWRDAKAGGARGLRTTFVFHDLITKALGYDFVFFDMGPSLGAINRALLLASDFFVLPASIDIFSRWAIQNIGQALKVWQKELKQGMANAEDPDEMPEIDAERLRFLGYVTQQHKERRTGDQRRIVEAYDAISKTLPSTVFENLSDLFADPAMRVHLGEIKHLASLAPKSQSLHQPMINVVAKGSYTVTRKQAREIYSGIGHAFLANIGLRNPSSDVQS